MAKLESLIVDLQVQNTQLKAGLEQANAKLDAFGEHVDSVAKGMSLAFGAVIAKQAFDFLSGLVTHSAEAADATLKMSQAAGVSTESLSKLGYAASMAGVGQEELGVALGKMNKNLAAAYSGSKTAQESFAGMGISVTDASGKLKNADAVLYEVADKFKGMADGSAKSAIAMDLFGKSGARLIPLLNGGGEGLKAMGVEASNLGLVLTTEAATAAERFNDAIDRVRKVGEGMAAQLSSQLTPSITAVAEGLTDFVQKQDLVNGFGKAFSYVMKAGSSAVVGLSFVIQSLGTQLNTLIEALQEAVSGNFERIPGVFKRNADTLVKLVDDAKAAIDKIWAEPSPGAPGAPPKPSGSDGTGSVGGNGGVSLKITMGDLVFNPKEADKKLLGDVTDYYDQLFSAAVRYADVSALYLPSPGSRPRAEPRKAFGGASGPVTASADTRVASEEAAVWDDAWETIKKAASGVGGALKGFGGMLGDIGRNVLGKLGAVGQAVGSAIDKLVEGDVWGAVGAFLSGIITNLKAFEPLVTIAQGILTAIAPIFDGVLAALKPVLGAVGVFLGILMTAIKPALDGLVPALMSIAPLLVVIGKIVGAVLTPIMKALGTVFKVLADLFTIVLFPILKYVGLVILYVMKGLALAWNGIIDAIEGVLRWIGNFEIAGAKPLGFLLDWADTIDKAKATTSTLDGQINDLLNTTNDSAQAQSEDAAANYEASAATDKTAAAMQKVTASLTNIPSWFKVASERWHAATGTGGTAGLVGAGGGGVRVYLGNEEIAARIERWQQTRDWRKGRG